MKLRELRKDAVEKISEEKQKIGIKMIQTAQMEIDELEKALKLANEDFQELLDMDLEEIENDVWGEIRTLIR